jgi:hypothetical protein
MTSLFRNLIGILILTYLIAHSDDANNLSWMLSADLTGIRLSGFKGPTTGGDSLVQQFNKFFNVYGGSDEIGLAEGYKIITSKKLAKDSVLIEVEFTNVVESIFAEKWSVKKIVRKKFVFVNGKIEIFFIPFVHPASLFRHYAYNTRPEFDSLFGQLRKKIIAAYPNLALKE